MAADASPWLTGLNSEQRAAAEDLERHILLLAPAGTGKTNTIASRIAEILAQKDIAPEEILCLTFTNKACREMQKRISARAGEAGSRVVVRTFHGFCYDIIKAEAKRASDFYSDFTIFDEVDARGLLKELVGDGWPELSLYQLVSQLKEAYAEEVLVDGASADGAHLAPDRGSGGVAERAEVFIETRAAGYPRTLSRLFRTQEGSIRAHAVDERHSFYRDFFEMWRAQGADITARYDARLRDMHGLDFLDLIIEAGRVLQDDAVRAKWTRRFSYIHIDEVQDTSELEYGILSKIFGASRLFLAGDFFQTIYEWRGSRPEMVLRRYQEAYLPRRIVLYDNYRATKTLLAASFACLKNLFPERVSSLYEKEPRAETAEVGKKIVLRAVIDLRDEAQWIYYKIQQLGVSDYARVAILTRNNAYNKKLSEFFLSFGRMLPVEERLPFMLVEEQKFFRRQEVKDALAFLKLTVNPHDAASLIRVLNRFGRGIGPKTIKDISEGKVRASGMRITDLVHPVARRDGDPYALLLGALAQENVVVFDVEATGVDPTRDEIIQIAGIRINQQGEITQQFERVLTPTKSVGDSVRIHHMTDDWLKENGEDAGKVLAAFCRFADGAVIVGHNVTYDLSILASHLSRLGMPAFSFTAYYDTLDIYRRFYPNLPNHKLETIGKFVQVRHASSHNALDDIKATAEILIHAVDHDIVPRAENRRAYMARWMPLFAGFAEKIAAFQQAGQELRPWQLLGKIVIDAGISAYYEKHKELVRVENLRDLFRQARQLDDVALSPQDALLRFLRYTALSDTALDMLEGRAQIPIITVHQAKGSEFDQVFIAGLQEGTFPGWHTDDARLAEEARLFYVALTRARRELYLSWCQTDRGHYRHMSRFIREIPREYIESES